MPQSLQMANQLMGRDTLQDVMLRNKGVSPEISVLQILIKRH